MNSNNQNKPLNQSHGCKYKIINDGNSKNLPEAPSIDEVETILQVSSIKNGGNLAGSSSSHLHRPADLSPTLSTGTGSIIEELRTDSAFPHLRDYITEIVDPNSDPDNPVVVEFKAIQDGMPIIRDTVEKTPCRKSRLSILCNMELFFKRDYLQYTGNFKERGASLSLLKLKENRDRYEAGLPIDTDPEKYPVDFNGVIAASAGNHALALAYHGQLSNISVTVVMPKYAPIMKINACKQFNATVIIEGDDMAEAKNYAMKLGKEKNLVYINGYDHPDVIAGQGTMGMEICEQMGEFDGIIIPVGGGGLLAGVAVAIKHLRPNVMIIGAEAVRCTGFANALKAGKPIYTPSYSSLADGLAVPVVGYNAFETARNIVDKMVSVNEEHIALAILRLIEMEKAVVEGAGACGFAAVLAGLVPELEGKKVVILLSGGNIDTSILGRCIDRGLAADGRLIRFKVTILDRPGGIAELTAYLNTIGVSLKDIFHERAWLKNDVFSVDVKCVCETRDWEHTFILKEGIKQRYPNAKFEDLEYKMAAAYKLALKN